MFTVIGYKIQFTIMPNTYNFYNSNDSMFKYVEEFNSFENVVAIEIVKQAYPIQHCFYV